MKWKRSKKQQEIEEAYRNADLDAVDEVITFAWRPILVDEHWYWLRKVKAERMAYYKLTRRGIKFFWIYG